jgi:glycosyltransferase involved in cell wall biosynthesis
MRPIVNLWRLARATFRVERCARVLFFASAGASFYEKLAWLLLVRIAGRHAVMVMVDGNFPAYWNEMSVLAARFARVFVSCERVTIGVQSEQWRCYYKDIFPRANCVTISATVSQEFRTAPLWKDEALLPTVLYVGWMIPGKGVFDLLQAFQKVKANSPQARLCLVGPSFDRAAQLHAHAQELGIAESVDFIGPVDSRATLIELFRSATVFVLPSHAEGFPVALLEAMTLGVPCVASDVGGIPDLLDHGGAGIIVPPGDPANLAKALNGLLENTLQRKHLSLQAANRARTAFGDSAFIESYLNILGLQ